MDLKSARLQLIIRSNVLLLSRVSLRAGRDGKEPVRRLELSLVRLLRLLLL